MQPPRSKDLFAAWLATVTLIVAATAGGTAGMAILRPMGWDNTPRVIEISLTATPPPIQPQPEQEPDPIEEPPATLDLPPPPVQVEPEPIAAAPEEVPEPEAQPTPKPEIIKPAPKPIVETRPPPPRPKPSPVVKVTPKPKPQTIAPRNLSRPAGVLRQVAPRYPRGARKSGAAGTAYVTVSLDAQGKVQSSSISRSSGHSSLDSEALRTVKRWKFRPALSRSGQPTRSQARVPVVFRLR